MPDMLEVPEMDDTQDPLLARYLVTATLVQLQIDEYFVPDLGPPDDYQGPHLVATAHADRLATLGSAGRRICELPLATATTLLDAAMKARDEKIDLGVDTAIGRPLTVLTLRVDHARGAKQSFACRAVVNHYVPRALPPHWSTVLRIMRDVAGRVDAVTADAWDRALTWSSPVELGALWQVGSAVRLPHVVTSIAHDGTLYLRTGQLPQPSRLYQLAEGVLTCLDDKTVIAPVERRYILPCGGGVLMLQRQWQKPLRIVIRAEDDRGIYVQRGAAGDAVKSF